MNLANALHSDPYLDDGNVVIAATAQNGSTHVFRVYRGLLCRQSPIFADMFTVSSSPDSTVHELYDGAPVIRMPDAAEDLGDLLKMMLNPSPILIHHLDPRAPAFLEGALKLSTKYEIQGTRSLIVKHLQAAWPQSYDSYRAQKRQIQKIVEGLKNGGMPDPTRPFVDDHVPEPALAIRVARLYNLPDILPAAYYVLYTLFNTQRDWHTRREDTTDLHLKLGGRTFRTELLDAVDLRRLVFLQEQFEVCLRGTQSKIEAAQNWVDECPDWQDCNDAAKRAAENIFGLPRPIGTDPLWRTEESSYRNEEGLCMNCCEVVTQAIDEEAKKLWESVSNCLNIV